jgi:signal transduction histidine kinase
MTHQIDNPLFRALKLATELKAQAEGNMHRDIVEIVELLSQLTQSDAIQQLETAHSHFVSFMVHELRKPMTSIRGYADMLDKRVVGELNDMQGQFVSTIRRNVISMEKLLADLSDYSKMSVGRIKAEPKMDLAKNILLDVQKQTTEMAAEYKHQLVFEVPDGLPLLNLDGIRVKQALIKLVENALKYTPEGGQVVVSAQPVDGGLEILVKDHGVGMHPEEIARLGELFFRGDDPLVTNSKGYGLGIPIVLECMKLTGGHLFYKSEKNVGSTFGIFLPAMS